jgi:RNA polymerase sigma factor (sigma-70 family)
MPSNRLNGLLQHLLRSVRPLGDEDSDAGLLELYLRQRDEAAFESLMLRHGPLVLGVCRRVLGNSHDAEDAFQATFLILIRKAASLRRQAALGAWLYRVAYRTAQEARRALARRRAREARVVPREEAAPQKDDLREVLDRELSALPERYRAAVVVCDLEGKERKEAAQQLGCPEGTVASRLARGRQLLARRLTRHGLTAGALAALSHEAQAGPSAALLSATVRAARCVRGPGGAGALSANVSFLVERVVRNMLVVKLRAMTVVLLLVGMVGAGAGWLYYHREAAAQPNPGGRAVQPVEGPGAEQAPDEGRKAEKEEGLPKLLDAKPIRVDRQDDELQKLLKERYNEALAELSVCSQLYQVGRIPYDQLVDAAKRLVTAGLELKDKPDEKVALLRQYVEMMKGFEKITETRLEAGRIGPNELHQARYHRMSAEIELIRLKRKVRQPLR